MRLELGGYLLEEIDATIGIAPLVIVPGDKLEEVIVEFDTGTRIKDARAGVMDEVAGDNLILGVTKHTLEVGLACLLHGRADLLVAGGLGGFHGEIDHGDGRRGNPESHAGDLPLHFGTDEGDSLCCTGGGWDDVDGRRASTLPILLGGAIHRLLGGGVAVHGRHEALLDPETFLQEDVDHGSEAVRGATGVGDNAVFGDVEFIIVDTHHDGDVLVFRGCGDNDLLGAGSDVALGLLTFGEEARGLDDDINVEIFPGKSGRALLDGKALDLVAIHHERVIFLNFRGGFLTMDLTLEDSLCGVVFNEVG